jgi:hypothetical protein
MKPRRVRKPLGMCPESPNVSGLHQYLAAAADHERQPGRYLVQKPSAAETDRFAA